MPPRCPNGYRRNKKTGECVAKSAVTKEPVLEPVVENEPIMPSAPSTKPKRCPKGTRKNKNGECIFFDALEETQSKMEYYKNMQPQFPDLAKISLKIMGKRDYSNDSNKMPWSQHAIDILNDIATNNKKSAFDYSKLSKY